VLLQNWTGDKDQFRAFIGGNGNIKKEDKNPNTCAFYKLPAQRIDSD
jgi:hypothetical protein